MRHGDILIISVKGNLTKNNYFDRYDVFVSDKKCSPFKLRKADVNLH
jgi:hypothetical protein